MTSVLQRMLPVGNRPEALRSSVRALGLHKGNTVTVAQGVTGLQNLRLCVKLLKTLQRRLCSTTEECNIADADAAEQSEGPEGPRGLPGAPEARATRGASPCAQHTVPRKGHRGSLRRARWLSQRDSDQHWPAPCRQARAARSVAGRATARPHGRGNFVTV